MKSFFQEMKGLRVPRRELEQLAGKQYAPNLKLKDLIGTNFGMPVFEPPSALESIFGIGTVPQAQEPPRIESRASQAHLPLFRVFQAKIRQR